MATSAGLVSVTTGSLVVSGSLTSFVAPEGDQFILRGITAIVARAISPSQLQLKKAWPGPDISGASDWDISLTGPSWQSTVVTNRRLTDLLAQFEAGPIKWDAQGSPGDRAKYNDQIIGFVFLSLGDPWTLYTKIANTGSPSDWSSGQAIRGSPAESTVEAQAARDDALVSANSADRSSEAAAGSAGSAAGSAGAAAGSAGTAAAHASTALSARGDALAAAGQAAASAGATQADRQTVTALAGQVEGARQDAAASGTAAAVAASSAQAASSAALVAKQAADQQAASAALLAQSAAGARDMAGQQAATAAQQAAVAGELARAAAAAANEARATASLIGLQIYDFSFDSEALATDDWSN